MKKALITLVISLTICGFAYEAAAIGAEKAIQVMQSVGSNIPVSRFAKMATSTASTFTITTSSLFVLGTSTSRNYAEVSATVPMWCMMDNGNAAVIYRGMYVASGTPYVISADRDNLYYGTINCLAAGGSGQVSAIQY